MLRGIDHWHASLLRYRFHAVFPLGEHLEEFEAVRTRQGFANARKLLVEVGLEGALLLLIHICHDLLFGELDLKRKDNWYVQILYYSIVYLNKVPLPRPQQSNFPLVCMSMTR